MTSRFTDVFPNRVAWAGLAACVFVLSFVGLGNHGLFEPDEGRYAGMALEWTEFDEHDWAEPMLEDVGHYDKPPLVYWLTGTSFLVFGQTEWAARLPSIFGGFLTLIGVALIAGRTAGQRAAWWAVLVAASSYQFWALSHLLSPDMLMCGFATMGAALCLWGGQGRKGLLLWFAGAVFWGLAWWTKATASLVPLGALTAALLITGRKDLLARLRPLRLLALILILGLPWYVVMVNRHPELFDFFIGRELVGRVTGHVDKRTGFPGYHLVVAIGFWLPWWPLIFYHWRKTRSERKVSSLKDLRRTWSWEVVAALGVIAVFSLVSSKLVTYILPGLPFIAARAGVILAGTYSGFSWRQFPVKIALATAVFFVLVAFSIPKIEGSVRRNSSVRKAVEAAKNEGATQLVFGRFFPGAGFYFGESVWYVDTPDLVQVKQTKGQDRSAHFVSGLKIVDRVAGVPGPVWLLSLTRENSQLRPWQKKLIEAAKKEGIDKSIPVGDFTLYRVK